MKLIDVEYHLTTTKSFSDSLRQTAGIEFRELV